ncbi:Zinc finger A20 and AN1 domain-containing stress-associated protein 8 [Capsicum baccatum]|uniref:Zinc finger A20 and AN1 domain-containing stress-associated protein 8 n=1 Tax=Capsicum baccatum TaxID=33114 RepID=A0A2G2V9H9_CAPBA|nr:Zinc finger A20 and AN1 domain-containing stress-associated protein 8 [Capsicum baccatum]
MKAPSLVARLMGLESMPAGSGSKPRKASASETWSNVVDKLGARPGGSDKEDMHFEIAEIVVQNQDKVLAESVDSTNDEPLFPEPDRDLSDCRCSGVFFSMLFIICFLQELNPLCQLADLLYLWRAEKEDTYKVEEYIIGSGENKPRYLNVLTPQAENSHNLGERLRSTNTEMESSKETGCRAPKDPVLHINDCDFFGSASTMNMCSKCQKDIILLKQEHAKLAAASSKDVRRRSLSSDELKLALAGAAVASADLASQISQVKSKEGLKKCTTCRKRVGITGFICKCGDLFCAVHHYSEKHICSFDYRNAGQNTIAKANRIIVAEKLDKI